MPDPKMFKAKLKFFNGEISDMPVPGIQRDDGLIMVPESISIENNHFFELDRKFHVVDHFLYHEVKALVKKIAVPFREDLH